MNLNLLKDKASKGTVKAMNAKERRCFTIIELLVVISIIAILASLLLPALSSVREKGKAIACQSNMKQIGTASALYCNDYDGYILAARFWTGWGDMGGMWWNDIWCYNMNGLKYTPFAPGVRSVWACPTLGPANDLIGTYNRVSNRDWPWKGTGKGSRTLRRSSFWSKARPKPASTCR